MDKITPERWQQVEALARSALERGTGERCAYLEGACRGDAALRREVEDRIAMYELAGRSQDTVLPRPSFEPPPVVELDAGHSLGPYRLLRRIGRGSMATVFLAERISGPRQQGRELSVAVKVAERGFDSVRLAACFRAEQQALGRLDHPNIARLHDRGQLDDGRPYTVMEYVDGEPIDEHCDRLRLPIDGGLELFRQVCAVVHYAHCNRVVHRDIKPTNVLVTRRGVPKLLDFGIALDLTGESAEPAAPAERPMTPLYASPEQVRGQRVSHLSDVYSLGVLLYRLLTGRLPYGDELRGPREMAQLLDGGDPPPPSAVAAKLGAPVSRLRGLEPEELRRRLAAGLDAIVLKALAQPPELRHASAEQLAEEIRRSS